jgi:hypothetical protein
VKLRVIDECDESTEILRISEETVEFGAGIDSKVGIVE